MAVVYSLKKKDNTDEMHLFECKPNGFACDCNEISICGKMKKNEPHRDEFSCANEDVARLGAANRGRKVCGICVSRLYATW